VKSFDLVTAALGPKDLLGLDDRGKPEARFAAVSKLGGASLRNVKPGASTNVLAKKSSIRRGCFPGRIGPHGHRDALDRAGEPRGVE